jgi:hypothetical protein
MISPTRGTAHNINPARWEEKPKRSRFQPACFSPAKTTLFVGAG